MSKMNERALALICSQSYVSEGVSSFPNICILAGERNLTYEVGAQKQ
jgi:hypothetical protein